MPSAAFVADTTEVRVLSNGFALWKDKEKRDGRSIPLETIARECGLARMTVRRVCGAPNADISGLHMAGVAKMARYLDATLDDLVRVVGALEIGRDAAAPDGGGR